MIDALYQTGVYIRYENKMTSVIKVIISKHMHFSVLDQKTTSEQCAEDMETAGKI